jgi:ABC-2 type transport system ATP-binding protein
VRTITVFGGRPAGSPAQLARVGFVAQDAPVYARLTVSKHLRMGGWLNPGWDAGLAAARIEQTGLDLRQRAGSLSGGQRAQLALTLALASGRSCWCWMSRLPVWTRWPAASSWRP